MENNKPREEDVIDLAQIGRAIWRHILVIITIALAGALVASAYTKLFVKPTYRSTARMLVLTKETTLASLADLQMGSQLTKDYSELITAPPVLNKVIEELDLSMSYKKLAQMVSVDNPASTRILEVTVTANDPYQACEIVNSLATVSADSISDIMEVVPPKIFSEGEVPTAKSSPSLPRNAVIGALIGALVAIVIVVVISLMDDSIKSEEDIEKHLGLSTLASVPDRTIVKKSGSYGYYSKGGGSQEEKTL